MKVIFYALISALLFFHSILIAESISLTLDPSLIKRVEAKRGLLFKQIPNALILSDEIFKEKISHLIAIQTPEERLKREEIVFKLLFLIPETYPYFNCLSDSLNQSALALYDFTTKTLIIKKGNEQNEEILSHELIHALQDQYFDLSHIQNILNESTNRGLAIASLLEGDALIHQLPQNNKETSKQVLSSPNECKTPETLAMLFHTPYDFGRAKVSKIINDFSISSLNSLIKNVIASSNFFYLGSTAPIQPKAQLVKNSFTDSLGPLFYKVLLQKHNKTSQSIIAIRGISYDKILLENNHLNAEVRFIDSESMNAFWNSLLNHYSSEFSIPISTSTSMTSVKHEKYSLAFSRNVHDLKIYFTVHSH